MTITPRNLPNIYVDGAIVFCFKIRLQDGVQLLLTSSSEVVECDKMLFLPNSSLKLVEGELNDSGQNYLLLRGIFENGGIDRSLNLVDARFEILLHQKNRLYPYLEYICSSYNKYDLEFQITLEPDAVKYHQPLLKSFSKTCRAKFGDSFCKVNKNLYKVTYAISDIVDRTIVIPGMNKPSGYFSGGEAMWSNTSFTRSIESHISNNIILSHCPPDVIKHMKTIILTPGCDKEFVTCCNKFNNAINFRGEPFIPTSDALKIK